MLKEEEEEEEEFQNVHHGRKLKVAVFKVNANSWNHS